MELRRIVTSFVLAALAGCADKPLGTLVLSLGGEKDALTRAPAPTELTVEAVGQDRAVSPLAAVHLPASTIELGEFDMSRVASVRVTASDGEGVVLLRGLSPPLELGALNGTSLPIFMQRTAEFARMPSPLADGREDPLAVTVVGRYLAVAGGAGETSQQGSLYDLGYLHAYRFPRNLPRVPASLAASGSVLLVIDSLGASWVDLATFRSMTIVTPEGGTFGEVAGGATITAEDGASYVVGATRPSGEPSSRALRVDADGTLTFVSLTRPRLGAAAAWAKGRGLVVVGGSADGAGAEIVGAGATTAVALPYPPRAVAGAAAAALDDGRLLLIGGTTRAGAGAPTEIVDLACTTACAARPWSAPLPAPLTRAEAFFLGATAALVVGTTSDGNTLTFRVDEGTTAPVALRIPRQRARAVRLYTGSIAVVGGADTVESYAP